jgi:hypothetical protein
MEDSTQKPPGKYPLPEGFFEDQLGTILKKTVEVENWSLPQSKNVESFFPVPEGYWLGMEDGIRNRINPPVRSTPISVLNWKMATMLASIVLVLGIGYFTLNRPDPIENWSAQLEKVTQDELIASLDFQNGDVIELTEQMAGKVLMDKDLPSPPIQLNDSEIDQALEDFEKDDFNGLVDFN